MPCLNNVPPHKNFIDNVNSGQVLIEVYDVLVNKQKLLAHQAAALMSNQALQPVQKQSGKGTKRHCA